MTEDVIDRVDELVRKNNIKYKGNKQLIQIKKIRKPMNRHLNNMKSIIKNSQQNSMLLLLKKETEKPFRKPKK